MSRFVACALALVSLTASARWYDSEGGMFLSRDQIPASAYLQTPNAIGPWSYANLNPARFTDPDGREAADCARLGLHMWTDEWNKNPLCRGGSSPEAMDLAYQAYGAEQADKERAAKAFDEHMAFTAWHRRWIGRPLFITTSVFAGGAGATACAVTPGCGYVALTAGAAGLAAAPDPAKVLMSPVRACGEALTSGAGVATAADAECFSSLGALAVGGETNRPFLQSLKEARSPVAWSLGETPQGFTFWRLTEVPGALAGVTGPNLGGPGLNVFMAAGGRGFGAKGTIESGPTAGDRGRYSTYKSEKQGEQKPFKKFWDWFSSSRGGRSGGPEHQAIQNFIAGKLGPGSTEKAFGSRFADAAGQGEIHQIGGLNARWDPISRERSAVKSIINSGDYANQRVFFWDKANPTATEPTLEYVNGAWEPFLGVWR